MNLDKPQQEQLISTPVSLEPHSENVKPGIGIM